MNENRSNTLLLTVIAVATLLVAVVGATFAYFTAQTDGGESASTIIVTGGEMKIQFADGSAALSLDQHVTDIEPSYAPIITKQFTLTGNNSTDIAMPYSLDLVIVNNTFLDGSLSYTFTVENQTGGTPATAKPNQESNPIPGRASTAAAAVQNATEDLGNGSFAGNSTDVVHTYQLEIYFMETGEVQDDDKNAVFAGYVAVVAERATA